MKILLTDVGKRYNRDWIFRHLTYEFSVPNSYAITGPNGSGKSTLLQVIAGAIEASEGSLQYQTENNRTETGVASNRNGQTVGKDIFRQISISAPYLELVEELTAVEFLSFHARFKPLINGQDIKSILNSTGLETAIDKQIRYFSSGMKQRLKLAQAIFSDTPVVLLDEPCTNLDEAGIELYHHLIKNYCHNRLVIVSSNDKIEYNFCNENVLVSDYKK